MIRRRNIKIIILKFMMPYQLAFKALGQLQELLRAVAIYVVHIMYYIVYGHGDDFSCGAQSTIARRYSASINYIE